ITKYGSANSHTAILARTMNIPALMGVDISRDWDGKMAVIDGKEGIVYIDPEVDVLQRYLDEKKKEQEVKELLLCLKGLPDVTLDGRQIKLYANIGGVADVANVLANDGAGIGLFRSEFLYLEKNNYPTEEEQFQEYKTVVQNMAGKKVIIRTLDIGADKQVDYFGIEKEENPAMGYRAIRICLDRVDMFKTQLRAIYRASAFGTVAIMFPMIISLDEILRIKEICKEIERELTDKGIGYGAVEIGIMIETPASVMISDILAKEVDFFSVGTNDLTQYTLAVDRQNPKLDNYYDSKHEAVLRMIKMVVDNGHKEGIWVGICGELASDTSLVEKLVKMGIDELSVSPGYILPIRKIIREIK
ncbi:MAG: phosphoenolpyruvate--protein phosphotransferase, partial [Lachnospiraceae bacterium]|nr:phosphoenolpyruvate--protein phosphotransferase [Lachnospiraceae bacterium]